jgi:hypothetical protein
VPTSRRLSNDESRHSWLRSHASCLNGYQDRCYLEGDPENLAVDGDDELLIKLQRARIVCKSDSELNRPWRSYVSYVVRVQSQNRAWCVYLQE